jgi:hypothetical protein
MPVLQKNMGFLIIPDPDWGLLLSDDTQKHPWATLLACFSILGLPPVY